MSHNHLDVISSLQGFTDTNNDRKAKKFKCKACSTIVILVRRSIFARIMEHHATIDFGKKTGGAFWDTSGRQLIVLILFLVPVELYRRVPWWTLSDFRFPRSDVTTRAQTKVNWENLKKKNEVSPCLSIVLDRKREQNYCEKPASTGVLGRTACFFPKSIVAFHIVANIEYRTSN